MGCSLLSCCYVRWVNWRGDREAAARLAEVEAADVAGVMVRYRAPQESLRHVSEATSSQERGSSHGTQPGGKRSRSWGSRPRASAERSDPRRSSESVSQGSRPRASYERGGSRRPSEEMIEHERRMGELGPLPSIPAVPAVLELPYAQQALFRQIPAARPSSPRPRSARPDRPG